MGDKLPSELLWRNHANIERAETDAARALQQNISYEELKKQDEAERLSKMPDAVEPENQEAISQSMADARTYEMQEKLNEQYEATTPEASAESSHTTNHSLFGFDGEGSGDGDKAQTNDQATGGRLFGEGHTQDLDNGDGI